MAERGRLGGMALSSNRQTVTAADVAEMAGVSKWTVIRAFKTDARISDETRERVLEAAGRLNYQPNLLARSLATNRTQQVAVLVDDFENPYKLPTLKLLTAGLQREGMLTIIVNINDDFTHQAAVANARQRRIDAIVFFGTSYDPAVVSEPMFAAPDRPVFVLARESRNEALPSVFTDPVHAVNELGRHLYDRGYRKPLFVGGPVPISTALGRRRQYRKFWKERGIDTLAEINAGVYDYKVARRVVREYFSNSGDAKACDVLLCENDILALAALDVVRHDLGLRVPEEMAVVGFDDIDLAAAKSYDLTTYRQPVEEMVEELIEMIVGRKAPRTREFRGEVVLRSTT